MLWRRYFQKEETAGEAEGMKETDAPGGKCGNPSEGIHERFETG